LSVPLRSSSGTNDLEEDPSSLRHVSMGDFEKAFNKMKQSKFLTPMPMRYIDVEWSLARNQWAWCHRHL